MLMMQVLLDGENVRNMNVKWLRRQIGVVSQEPVLFDASIKDNIAMGKDGISMTDIENACIKANAHSFISALPKVSELRICFFYTLTLMIYLKSEKYS